MIAFKAKLWHRPSRSARLVPVGGASHANHPLSPLRVGSYRTADRVFAYGQLRPPRSCPTPNAVSSSQEFETLA